MQIYRGLEELPAQPAPSAITIGNFDGVHLGHQRVLGTLAEQAARYQARSVAVTFDPHPAFVHRPESTPQLLTGLGEKLARIEAAGAHTVLVLPYNEELYMLSAEEFVSRYFVDALNAAVVVVGHDIHFGRARDGDFTTMVDLGGRFGFDVVGVDDLEIMGPDGQQLHARCSSTAIRTALADGDVASAARMLGQPHSMTGEVVHGQARGRELGFPTANLAQDAEGLIPADGIYAGWLFDENHMRWPAAISVGSNPTFQGVERVVEAHVIDRTDASIEDFDLYGQQARVEFVERLRGMVAFEGIEKLCAQMAEDVDQTRRVLAQCRV
ncbi:bifunctional riboflavin kinase/FAD synthetase [Nesterenkonia populi]|uniref:bifunctional riboflavin kinase/FAD synthetase n=1 Tax=Nesterenkonia populi TaxID=1591087 RepID=UPI0011BED301|nr:bifunctional riboflavin kinase/FAD synthetase [Nesterenkonia populi]